MYIHMCVILTCTRIYILEHTYIHTFTTAIYIYIEIHIHIELGPTGLSNILAEWPASRLPGWHVSQVGQPTHTQRHETPGLLNVSFSSGYGSQSVDGVSTTFV